MNGAKIFELYTKKYPELIESVSYKQQNRLNKWRIKQVR